MRLVSIRLGLWWLGVLAAAACGGVEPTVRLVEDWPTAPAGNYAHVTERLQR